MLNIIAPVPIPAKRRGNVVAEVSAGLSMTGFCVRLFGIPSISIAEIPVSHLPVRSMELVCFLLIHHGRTYNRDTLSSILWPDDDAGSARRYLRQALWKLNAALHIPQQSTPELVRSQAPGRLQVNPEAVSWADVSAFERVHGATREMRGDQITEADARTLNEAVELYRGDLLAGWQREWCLPDRTRLEQAYFAMLEQLMAFHETRHEYAKGIVLGHRVLDRDAARETAHRQLMRLHHLSGDRAAAIRQFQQCADTMAAEFSVRPSAMTVDLYRRICVDEAPGEQPGPAPLPLVRGTRDTAVELAARLDEIQASLHELTRLVLRDRS